MEIPKEIEAKVVQRLFSDAEREGWTHLSPGRRTHFYNQWVQDPEVGGRLCEFVSPAEARVWIKDGPMKEFSRAVYGFGKYSVHVANLAAGPNKLVERALGPGWVVDMDTREIKPLRLIARRGEEDIHFAWGSARDLKHLLWAAIKAQADGDDMPWYLCVVGSFEKPTPSDEKKLHLRISEWCGPGVEIVHVDG